MVEKAEAAGVKHMVCFTNRWTPYCRYLKQLIEEGYIGRCFHGHFRYLGGYGRQADYGWRFDRQHANGALGDLGSHMIDLARWFVGDIARVSAHLGVYVDRPGPQGQALDPANDAALLVVEFANGAQGVIQLSAVAHTGDRLQEQHIVLHGQSGTLEIDAYYLLGVELRGIREGEKSFRELVVPDEMWGDVNRDQPLIAQAMEAFLRQPIGDRLFIDAILDDCQVTPSFYDGLKAQEVVDAAMRSHQEGCWVSIARTEP
jgi:predicted dehydrogenase